MTGSAEHSSFITSGQAILRAFPSSSECAPSRRFMVWTSREVAAIMGRCHAGILTSWFEGMPCYLLELLSVGRPMVAVTLPQYRLVVEEGKSGYLVERDEETDRLADALADRLIDTWAAIRNGTMSAATIRQHVIPFSVEEQLDRHFASHQQLVRC